MNSSELSLQAILTAHKIYNTGVVGGVVHDFLRDMKVEYQKGKCPVYYVCHYHRGKRIVIGGSFATNGKPEIMVGVKLDFFTN